MGGADAVALLHRAIGLDDYTEADQFVHKPGHALSVSAELDDPREPGLFWCVNPEVVDLGYGGDEEPVHVRNPDEAVCFARVNRFPPAVLLTGSETPDGRRLGFPSESDVRDGD